VAHSLGRKEYGRLGLGERNLEEENVTSRQWRIQELLVWGMICVGGGAEGLRNGEGYTPRRLEGLGSVVSAGSGWVTHHGLQSAAFHCCCCWRLNISVNMSATSAAAACRAGLALAGIAIRHESTDDIADVDVHFWVNVHQCQPHISRSWVMAFLRLPYSSAVS